MKLIKAYKDANGYHYVVHLDEAKPAALPDGTTFDPANTRDFHWRNVPSGASGKQHGGLGAPDWTEAAWIAMHEREIKNLLKAPAPAVPRALAVEGKTL